MGIFALKEEISKLTERINNCGESLVLLAKENRELRDKLKILVAMIENKDKIPEDILKEIK